MKNNFIKRGTYILVQVNTKVQEIESLNMKKIFNVQNKYFPGNFINLSQMRMPET